MESEIEYAVEDFLTSTKRVHDWGLSPRDYAKSLFIYLPKFLPEGADVNNDLHLMAAVSGVLNFRRNN